jgi:hypothetical protein
MGATRNHANLVAISRGMKLNVNICEISNKNQFGNISLTQNKLTSFNIKNDYFTKNH